MRNHLARLAMAGVASLTLVGGAVGIASAATPQIFTWTNHAYDPDYFECGGQPIDGDWMVTHHLIIFYDNAGVPQSDIEKIDFTGVFVNPANGNTIADSGQSIFKDTLAPDYSYLTTVMTTVRKSAYFHAAGRTDFQSGRTTGVDKSAQNFDAACAVLTS
jgi:hypothetical protein